MRAPSRLLFVVVAMAAACFSDSTSPVGGGTNGGTGDETCPDGAGGCACYGNGTCDATFVCDVPLQICVSETCVDGQAGCLCDDGECADGLVCDAGLCAAPGGGDATGDTTAAAGSETAGPNPETTGGPNPGTTVGPADSTVGGDPPAVVMYFTSMGGASFGVNGGGGPPREAATTLCTNSMLDLASACNTAAAVLSVTEGDAVASLADDGVPFDVEVLNDTGAQVATSFAELLANGVAAPLGPGGGGVTYANNNTGAPDVYWTGSLASGAFDSTSSCMGWTDTDGNGAVGSSTEVGTGWIRAAALPECVAMTDLLCVCW